MKMSGRLHAPAAFVPEERKNRRYPLDLRLGGPQSQLDVEQREQFYPCWESNNTGRPACNLSL